MNRSVPIYPEMEIILKPDEQKLAKVRAPFIDEISGLAIIKIIDGGIYSISVNKIEIHMQQGSFGYKECRKRHHDP